MKGEKTQEILPAQSIEDIHGDFSDTEETDWNETNEEAYTEMVTGIYGNITRYVNENDLAICEFLTMDLLWNFIERSA